MNRGPFLSPMTALVLIIVAVVVVGGVLLWRSRTSPRFVGPPAERTPMVGPRQMQGGQPLPQQPPTPR
ncbi:MAG: hypothetical protein NZ959_10440 [Armatimonadetes bacterium]|nr:hypothetical protein [Armatimonadota bacterium]MDW8122713.1 hypothetical protein [Armatimonadota bacterium]